MKRLGVFFILSLLLLASCQQANKTIKLGALLSLTGDAANFGTSELNAVKMAVDDVNAKGGINGTRVELIVEDAKTLDTPTALSGLRKLVDVDGVKAVIGPTWDMPGVAEAADSMGVILVSASSTPGVESNKPLPHFYSTTGPIRAETMALARFAKDHGWSTVALVRDQDIFSETVSNDFAAIAKKDGLNMIDVSVPTGELDFRTHLIKLKNQQPDALFAAFSTEEPRGPLLRQLQEMGWSVPVLGMDSVENADLLKDFGQYAEGVVYYAYPASTPERVAFTRKYKELYGTEPTGPTAPNAYDAASAILSAFAQGAQTSPEIKKILDSTSLPSVTFGTLTFDDTGYVSVESVTVVMKTVKQGAFIEIS